MTTLANVFLVATIGFLGTMFDNFFAFAAQLVTTDRTRFRRIGTSQALGVATLVGVAATISSLLASIPIQWIGLMCVIPWALAAHAWRHPSRPDNEQYRRGVLTTFLVTIALGGDNLAVWIPLLRASGLSHAIVAILAFAFWDGVFIAAAIGIAGHHRVVTWGTRFAPRFVPWLYAALGILILLECHTI